MTPHEHTDPHGDGLTITHNQGRVWITCTSKHTEVTVGPLPADILDSEPERRDPSVDYHAMWWKAEREREKAEAAYEDLREQYGTAVREKDEWEANAEKAEERVHEAGRAAERTIGAISASETAERLRAEKAEQERGHWKREADNANEDLAHLRAAESRPLTVTDEMVERIRDAARDEGLLVGSSVARRLLTAALTEPPARPEWDALHAVLSRTPRPATTDELTDVLYAEGVRAPEDGAA